MTKRISVVAVIVTLGSIGCKQKRPSDYDGPISKMREFSDQMCACLDKACVSAVNDKMTRWADAIARDQKEPPRLDGRQTKEATELAERTGKCMEAAMSNTHPPAKALSSDHPGEVTENPVTSLPGSTPS